MRVDAKNYNVETGGTLPYAAKQNTLTQTDNMAADSASRQDVLLQISNEARSYWEEMLQKSREDKEKSNDAIDDMVKAMEIARQTSIFNTHKKHKDWKSLYKEEEERERRRRLEQEMGQETGTPGSIVAEGGVAGSGAAERQCYGRRYPVRRQQIHATALGAVFGFAALCFAMENDTISQLAIYLRCAKAAQEWRAE